jgi:hypothetical protein
MCDLSAYVRSIAREASAAGRLRPNEVTAEVLVLASIFPDLP